ncbi:primosomal protein [Pseudoalteromonas luteoviolacea]|uniref:Primosomal protein n=1 Tax=Pseudoalteromonas luteoviolacea TaxID=43657 RepID=A0A0C1QTM1_9GAMM|nr:primosomal replication protein [Pseudoalteromonas luteoviolacea]KID58337.1 primosomal protein [Pseudoalteromonas luteoviolacea]
MSRALIKLNSKLEQLGTQAHQFDNAKWFDKNRYIQNQPSLFDSHLFHTKSLLLGDYVDEIKLTLKNLPPEQNRHAYQFAVEQVGEQMQAIIKVLKSTPVWAKENKLSQPKKAKVFKKAVQRIMQSSHELYRELSQNHEFERRLQDMIDSRRAQLDGANAEQNAKLNAEILALHTRLGRCRKAISATEEKIQQLEKQGNR